MGINDNRGLPKKAAADAFFCENSLPMGLGWACCFALLRVSAAACLQVKVVPHAVALRLQVAIVVFRGRHLNGHVLHNLQSVCLQAYALLGVVGHQAHLVHSEVAQHLRSAAVVALIGLEAEVGIGVHGVESLFLLQLVGGYFVHQSDAAALLLHIDEYALALFLNHFHGFVELLSAVAAA